MKKQWMVVAGGRTIESTDGSLPKEIVQIRKYVDERGGSVPIEPYLSSVVYDEDKPETVLAAAYAYLLHETGLEPRVETRGVIMPSNYDEQRADRVY